MFRSVENLPVALAYNVAWAWETFTAGITGGPFPFP